MSQTPAQLMEEYVLRTNRHRFTSVAELIAEDAVFWFNDGSFVGHGAIRGVFEKTWALIQDEIYRVDDIRWLAVDTHAAVCVYTFHWQGMVNGQLAQGSGRGTSVLRKSAERWQIVHEHLSPIPRA